MSTTTYSTKIFSDTIKIAADFSQAACPVTGDIEGGYQVADFRHRPEDAMRRACEQLVLGCGDQPEEFEDEIDAAVDAMIIASELDRD